MKFAAFYLDVDFVQNIIKYYVVPIVLNLSSFWLIFCIKVEQKA